MKKQNFSGIQDTQKTDDGLIFRMSSFCQSGECVTIARGADGVMHVRDSKDATLRSLTFDKAEWAAFVKGVKNGEFDAE